MYLDILYSAINSPLGIEVRCSNTHQFRQELYAEMRAQKDQGVTDFIGLKISLSLIDPQSLLWITHGDKTQA